MYALPPSPPLRSVRAATTIQSYVRMQQQRRRFLRQAALQLSPLWVLPLQGHAGHPCVRWACCGIPAGPARVSLLGLRGHPCGASRGARDMQQRKAGGAWELPAVSTPRQRRPCCCSALIAGTPSWARSRRHGRRRRRDAPRRPLQSRLLCDADSRRSRQARPQPPWRNVQSPPFDATVSCQGCCSARHGLMAVPSTSSRPGSSLSLLPSPSQPFQAHPLLPAAGDPPAPRGPEAARPAGGAGQPGGSRRGAAAAADCGAAACGAGRGRGRQSQGLAAWCDAHCGVFHDHQAHCIGNVDNAATSC